ncbi:BBSome complex assembly protein BBS10 [Pholidichthys leucotaenia]
MAQLEHLHLNHVLQIVDVLKGVIIRSFGPEGGQVLFTRDTGQAMLSRSGTRILRALQLEHPLARMVVEYVWKHSSSTGDGSKTFILLLSSLLQMIDATASREPNVSRAYNSTEAAKTATARHLADKLLEFAFKELHVLISRKVVPHGCCVSFEDFPEKTQSSSLAHSLLQKLLATFFHTRLGYTHHDFLSHLTCELISNWKLIKQPLPFSLQFVNDNFSALHTPVSGFPASSSRIIEGQVIHRDFATPPLHTDHQPIKAIVFTGYLQPKLLNAGEVLKLGCGGSSVEERSIIQFSAWMEKSLEHIVADLQTLGISVILSAVKQSDTVLALTTQAEICLVECIGEEELSLFVQLSGATPVSDCRMIEPCHIASLAFCRPIKLGANRYVHVAFPDTEEGVKPCHLVICAPGEGQTEHCACAVQDAVRMILTTEEPLPLTDATPSKRTSGLHESSFLHTSGTKNRSSSLNQLHECVLTSGCVIPAGGTFEFLLSHALLQHGRTSSGSHDRNIGVCVTQLLSGALLSVPRKIYSHNPQAFLQTQTRVMSFASKHFHPLRLTGCSVSRMQSEEYVNLCLLRCPKGDESSKVSVLDLGLESVSCKYQMLLAVLQCLTSLLRVDAVLHINTTLHIQSRRLTYCEDTDDEAED